MATKRVGEQNAKQLMYMFKDKEVEAKRLMELLETYHLDFVMVEAEQKLLEKEIPYASWTDEAKDHLFKLFEIYQTKMVQDIFAYVHSLVTAILCCIPDFKEVTHDLETKRTTVYQDLRSSVSFLIL